MPKIQPYEQRTSAPRVPMVTPGDNGWGQAIAAVGDALQTVSNNIALVQRRDAAAEASLALSTLRTNWTHRFIDAQGSAAPDAADFSSGLITQFDADVQGVVKGTRSKIAAAAIKDAALSLREELYNKASVFEATARSAYRISTIERSIDGLQTAVQLDPDSWRKAAAEQLLAIDAMQLDPITRGKLRDTTASRLTEAAAMGYAQRDPRAMLAELSNPKSENMLLTSLSPAARDRVKNAATSSIVDGEASRILGVYERQGQDAGLLAMKELSASELPPLMRDDIRNKVNTGQDRLRDQRRQESADTLADIEESIANDTAGRDTAKTVQDLYQQGAMTPSEFASVIGRIERAGIERFRRDAVSEEVLQALQSGLPLDPNNGEHKKALAQLFARDTRPFSTQSSDGEEVTAFKVGSPEWKATAAAYANRARMLPSQATAWIRQGSRSPDADVAAASAQFFGAINAQTPDAISEIDPDTKAFAGTVNAMIEAGTHPTTAVETARTNVLDLKPEVVKRREGEYGQHVKQSDAVLNQLVDAEFDPGIFESPPTPTVGMRTDFESQANRYYVKTGDIGLARKLAWDDLKRVYGATRVNGQAMVMAFPPERYGVQPEDVRTDIGNFLKGNPQADGESASDIVLVPDRITMRQVSNALDGHPVQPSYRLVSNKTGDLVLDRNGVRKRYTLPSGEDLAKRFREADAKAEADARAAVDAARDQRQRERGERATWQRAYPRGK